MFLIKKLSRKKNWRSLKPSKTIKRKLNVDADEPEVLKPLAKKFKKRVFQPSTLRKSEISYSDFSSKKRKNERRYNSTVQDLPRKY